MIGLRLHIALIMCSFLISGYGQISPGDLTTAHSELEGMSNCTQCHDLGNKVTNAKCLDCHNEIKTLINSKQGYHASMAVKGKDCFECHSEHHGRKFDMVRFDQDNFDHLLTGYKLEGEHKVIDCRDCHKPEYIASREIKKLEDTFLGLSQECLSCHDDFHQETMDNDCKKCHDMKAWRPALRFDHDETEFKLRGGHIEVDCKECHETIVKNGVDFQVFAPVPHNDCVACHEDPHKDHFKGTCTQCHVDESFSTFTGKKNFNHNNTNFELKGKHRSTDCYACHERSSDPLRVFQDRIAVGVNQCATCHKDAHEGRFGNDCAKCHTEKSFLDVKTMDFFDHSVTDYPLEGKHIGVDCKKCHEERYTDPIDFSACMNCHEDYHEGEFTENGIQQDCKECHSLMDGFEVSLYTLEQHQETDFPLEGAHVATPCFACHVSEDLWSFKDLDSDCISCHDNVHGDTFAIDGITDCERCHVSDTWFPSLFDHSQTAFPLEGEHATVDCRACHKPQEGNGDLVFKIDRYECIDCHQ
jgi:hypothetical protein